MTPPDFVVEKWTKELAAFMNWNRRRERLELAGRAMVGMLMNGQMIGDDELVHQAFVFADMMLAEADKEKE